MLQPDEEETSDSSDEDYVPQAVEVSEEEESGEDENIAGDGEEGGNKSKKTVKKHAKPLAKGKTEKKRKRIGGIFLEDDDADEPDHKEEKRDLDKEIEEELKEKKAESEKKRVDDLWADFMKDVGPPARTQPSSTSRASTGAAGKTPAVSAPSTTSYSAVKRPEKVKVTKVFDFAGETVKVTKEVDAGSKEAKAVEKESIPGQKLTTSAPITGVKRPGGGLGSVLSMIGKKQKISTLDKSKVDWESFKEKEGIHEELQIHNRGKDGFIERKNFLERSDLREFEIEKNIRLANSSKR